MRESRTYGSVRGALRKERPYRERGGSVGGGTPTAARLAGTSLPLARVGFR